MDRDTRDLVPRGAELIDLANATHPDIHLEKEFLQNTVELVTGICHTVPEAIADLKNSLNAVEEAADKLGIDVWASGGHPFTDLSLIHI